MYAKVSKVKPHGQIQSSFILHVKVYTTAVLMIFSLPSANSVVHITCDSE